MATLGSKTFVWKKKEVWREDFLEIMGDIVDKELIRNFKLSPPEYVLSDDMGWLESIIEDVKGYEIDIESVFFDRFLEYYGAVRAFHACCPSDVSTYYDKGIIPLERQQLTQRAYEIFLSDNFPEVTESLVNKAINEVLRDSYREGIIGFELNDKVLVEHGGRFLLYGSEALIAVAMKLMRLTHGRDYRSELQGLGRPTVLVCNVPLRLISDSCLRGVCRNIISAFFESIRTKEPEEYREAYSISISETLPSECIIEHYHPDEIKDPYMLIF